MIYMHITTGHMHTAEEIQAALINMYEYQNELAGICGDGKVSVSLPQFISEGMKEFVMVSAANDGVSDE